MKRTMNNILLGADWMAWLADAGGEGGGGATWHATLPADLKDSAVLRDIPNVEALAKGYVSAQSMLGSRVALPGKDSKPEDVAAFYNKLGRPESADKYGMPELKLSEGLSIDDKKLSSTRELFHKLNLTDSQAKGVLEHYFGTLNEQHASVQQANKTGMEQASQKLREEFGDKFDAKVDVAKSVLQKFGTPELAEYLEKSGLGNDPHIVRIFAKIGDAMMEDGAAGGDGGLFVKDATAAAAEIEKLKQNPEFMKQLFGTTEAGHKSAVDQWSNLHKKAFPGAAE